MRLRNFITFIASVVPFTIALGQSAKDKPFMIVNGDTVSKSYFDYLYQKSMSASDNKISREEYIPLFTDFRLKVEEAKAQGLDTLKSYKKDVNNYREKLIAPYLIDTTALNELAREEYKRTLKDINTSHILIKIEEPMSPKDTLLAYNKAETAKRLLNNDSFDSVAVWMSDDPSVKRNFGYLGWTTAMQNVIDYENAIYNENIKKGDIIGPIRSNFGYHVIKINDIRKSQGEVLIAHIMKAKNDSVPMLNAKAKESIYDIYNRLQEGENFDELLKESDDKGTAENGGQLPWFGMGRMIDQIENTAFSLKNIGDYSKPVETAFGWHIIKLLGRKGPGTYAERENEIKDFITRSDRASVVFHKNALKLKNTYGYSTNDKLIQKLKKVEEKAGYNDSIFLVKTKSLLNEPVASFSFNGKKENYTFGNLVNFTERNHFTYAQLEDVLEVATDDTVSQINRSHIETLHPEILNAFNEYKDGTLQFEITQKEVWSKASQDTAGLRRTFEANKAKYTWKEPRWRGRIVLCKDLATEKKVNKILDSETDDEKIDKELRALNDKGVVVRSERGLFAKGSNKYVDAVRWGSDLNLPKDFKKIVSKGHDVTVPESYKEVRGQIIQDYQEELEKKWVENLRAKYPVKIIE